MSLYANMLKASHCGIIRVTKVWGHRQYKHKEMVCIQVTEYMKYWSVQWQKWAETFAFPFLRGMTSRNIPEERKHQLRRCRNLKTRNQKRSSSVATETHRLLLFLSHRVYNAHYSIGVVVSTENWKLFMVSIFEVNCWHQIQFTCTETVYSNLFYI
jgi:hypothetical protein